MKTAAGAVFVLLGALGWVGALASLIMNHQVQGNMPPVAFLYFVVPSVVIYFGVRLFQSGRAAATAKQSDSGSQLYGRLPSYPELGPKLSSDLPQSHFSIEIPEAVHMQGGIAEIDHSTVYSILLKNRHWSLRSDAKVWIDGNVVGTWRIGPSSTIKIERPANDTGRFTFFQLGTTEALRAGLDQNNPALGLIRVKFMPEADRGPVLASGSGNFGGTGLSGTSDQRFTAATPIQRDEFAEVVCEVRLVPTKRIRPLRTLV